MNTEGAVDIVTQLSPKQANEVRASKYAKLMNVGGKQVLAGVFNRFQEDVNFNDSRLRLAFNLAINRNEIIHKAFGGYATLVPALTPPWAFDFPSDLKIREHDPNTARKLLKEVMNWPKGRVLRVAAPQAYEKVAELVALQVSEALRIKVEVKIISSDEKVKWRRVLAEKVLNPNWDIFLTSATALFYEGTPAFFHREFFGYDGALRAGSRNEEFERLFEAMATETDKEKFLEKAINIDRYVYKESLALFLCAPHDLYAVNKHVLFKPYRTTLELIDTEVSEEHWSRR